MRLFIRKLMALSASSILLAASISTVSGSKASALGPCGYSYSYLNSYSMTVPATSTNNKFGKPGTRTGTLTVYRSSLYQRFCAVAYAYGPTVGMLMWRGIEFAPTSYDKINEDHGRYYQYAGPVYSKQLSYTSSYWVEAYFGPDKYDTSWGYRKIVVY